VNTREEVTALYGLEQNDPELRWMPKRGGLKTTAPCIFQFASISCVSWAALVKKVTRISSNNDETRMTDDKGTTKRKYLTPKEWTEQKTTAYTHDIDRLRH
jgi:hypothetical protein